MKTGQHEGNRVSHYFGDNTFDDNAMKDRISHEIYDKFKQSIEMNQPLDMEVVETIAEAMKEWAVSKGVTTYTHWFQPLTGMTAEKHDSFLSYDQSGKVIEKFTGHDLIKGEPDASSFPGGGLRSTAQARGYVVWDPSSPVFIIEHNLGKVLCIPSIFITYTGYALDNKTPLLKSMSAINESALKLLHILGENNIKWVNPMVGPEQEFFLIDYEYSLKRPDLCSLGYTLFGERIARGQQFDDHYFGPIPERVINFINDVESELYKLGIPAKTHHNEVAPNQFEMAPIYEIANVAADHNLVMMTTMKRIARHHNFAILFHEKPFARINGSGKHINWSLEDSLKRNLFSPGETARDNIRFLCFIMAVLVGVYRHADLLRAIISSPGNDYRLGLHEAPPAIISVFLGETLARAMEKIENGKVELGADSKQFNVGIPFIPTIKKDISDRNRTSPFAFTGNHFEFRALGASASISMPTAIINVIVADGLNYISEKIRSTAKNTNPSKEDIIESLKLIYKEVKSIHYEGDNYTEEWKKKAEEMGLPMAPHTPAAIKNLISEKNLNLMEQMNVLVRNEMHSRYLVAQDNYIKTVEIELRLTRNMIRTLYIPAALNWETKLFNAIDNIKKLIPDQKEIISSHLDYSKSVAFRLSKLIERLKELDEYNKELKEKDPDNQATFCAEVIRPALYEARQLVDQLEERIDASCWPVPRYWEMLKI